MRGICVSARPGTSGQPQAYLLGSQGHASESEGTCSSLLNGRWAPVWFPWAREFSGKLSCVLFDHWVHRCPWFLEHLNLKPKICACFCSVSESNKFTGKNIIKNNSSCHLFKAYQALATVLGTTSNKLYQAILTIALEGKYLYLHFIEAHRQWVIERQSHTCSVRGGDPGLSVLTAHKLSNIPWTTTLSLCRWSSNLNMHRNPLGFLTACLLGPTTRVPDSVGLGGSLRICILRFQEMLMLLVLGPHTDNPGEANLYC